MKTGHARLVERADERFVPTALRRVRVERRPGRLDAEAANGSADGESAEGLASAVAGEPGSAPDIEGASDGADARIARRWQGFLTLALARGVAAETIAAHFTDEDIADLCAPEHDDETLVRCMDTLAAEARSARVRDDVAAVSAAVRDEPSAAPRTVRCADCRHFRRRATHPHLGACAGDGTATVAGGFWDDQERGCEAFSALP